MRNKKTRHAAKKGIEAVANKNGMIVEMVRREIESAISVANNSADPEVQSFWNAVPHRGELPTIEEVITYVATSMAKNKELP